MIKKCMEKELSKDELEMYYKEAILLKQLIKMNPAYKPQFESRIAWIKTIINSAYTVPRFGVFHLYSSAVANDVGKEGRIQLQEILTANDVKDKIVL